MELGLEGASSFNDFYVTLVNGLLDHRLVADAALRTICIQNMIEFFPDFVVLLCEYLYEDYTLMCMELLPEPVIIGFCVHYHLFAGPPFVHSDEPAQYFASKKLTAVSRSLATLRHPPRHGVHPERARKLYAKFHSLEVVKKCVDDEKYARRVAHLYALLFPFSVPPYAYYFNAHRQVRLLALQYVILVGRFFQELGITLSTQALAAWRWSAQRVFRGDERETMEREAFASAMGFMAMQQEGGVGEWDVDVIFQNMLHSADTITGGSWGVRILMRAIQQLLDEFDKERSHDDVMLSNHIALAVLKTKCEQLSAKVGKWDFDTRVTVESLLNEDDMKVRFYRFLSEAGVSKRANAGRSFFGCELGTNRMLNSTMALLQMDLVDRVAKIRGIEGEESFRSVMVAPLIFDLLGSGLANEIERQRLVLEGVFLQPFRNLLALHYDGFVIYQFQTNDPLTLPRPDYDAEASYDETGENRLTVAIWRRAGFDQAAQSLARMDPLFWYSAMYPLTQTVETALDVLILFVQLLCKKWQSGQYDTDLLCGCEALVREVERRQWSPAGRMRKFVATYPYGGRNVSLVKLYVILAQALEESGLLNGEAAEIFARSTKRPVVEEEPPSPLMQSANAQLLQIMVQNMVVEIDPADVDQMLNIVREVQQLVTVMSRTSKTTAKLLTPLLIGGGDLPVDFIWYLCLTATRPEALFFPPSGIAARTQYPLADGSLHDVEWTMLEEEKVATLASWQEFFPASVSSVDELKLGMLIVALLLVVDPSNRSALVNKDASLLEDDILVRVMADAISDVYLLSFIQVIGVKVAITRITPTFNLSRYVFLLIAAVLVRSTFLRPFTHGLMPNNLEEFYEFVATKLSQRKFIDQAMSCNAALMESAAPLVNSALISLQELARIAVQRGEYPFSSNNNLLTFARVELTGQLSSLFSTVSLTAMPVEKISLTFKLYALVTINQHYFRHRDDKRPKQRRLVFHSAPHGQ
jgi:hypothetical protein